MSVSDTAAQLLSSCSPLGARSLVVVFVVVCLFVCLFVCLLVCLLVFVCFFVCLQQSGKRKLRQVISLRIVFLQANATRS